MAALPLAVTMGDPAGIGIEITLAAWRHRATAAVPPFALLADPQAVAARAAAIGITVPIRALSALSDAAGAFPHALPVLPIPLPRPAEAGTPDAANASAVIAAIETAVAAVVAGEASGVVTNPIAKHVLTATGFAHPGHTEFLGALASRHGLLAEPHPVMMLAASELRVVPLTVHVPLARVPALITKDAIVRTAGIIDASLRQDFAIPAPRISIAGLNPHAGESGTMGVEDRDIIAPAIAALSAQGLKVTGPHPADTLFHDRARTTYDAVLAMYHDQALIPIKTIAFDTAVNVTLGLPFVRTSPDHGTAFDIAGRGTASPSSLIAAIRLAAQMAHARTSRHNGTPGRAATQ